MVLNYANFTSSSIEQLNRPNSVEVLNDGWRYNTRKSGKIKIGANNKIFKNLSEKMLGKPDPESSLYDIL